MPRPRRISDEAVLDGALQVMLRKSPAEFTLASVAEQVGIAPATLIQRFGDKRSLIQRTLARDNSGFETMLAEAPRAKGREAVVGLFRLMTPEVADPATLAAQMLWLLEDFRDPMLNSLARERFRLMRSAVIERLPPLPIPPEEAALSLEALWQGAINQWGFFHEGGLQRYVISRLEAWFDLAEAAGGPG